MSASPSPAVVLTGCGWVTPLAGGTISQVFAAARRAGAPPAPGGGYWAVPDELVEDYPDLSNELKRDKGAWMTGVAFLLACGDASLAPDALEAERVGLVLGCALAGQSGMISFANEVRKQSPRFVSPLHFPQTVGNYIAGAMARGFTIRGPNLTLACGAASGLEAVARGWAILNAGEADLVFAGGTEELTDDLARGLAQAGVVLSEGACLFVLERADSAAARGVRPLAAVTGCSRTATDGPLPAGPERALVSCTSPGRPGAVFIEHWIGCCLGASGAAALAAAIGAADGGDVPLLQAGDEASVSVGRIATEGLAAADGSLRALAWADADGAHATVVELLLPPR